MVREIRLLDLLFQRIDFAPFAVWFTQFVLDGFQLFAQDVTEAMLHPVEQLMARMAVKSPLRMEVANAFRKLKLSR